MLYLTVLIIGSIVWYGKVWYRIYKVTCIMSFVCFEYNVLQTNTLLFVTVSIDMIFIAIIIVTLMYSEDSRCQGMIANLKRQSKLIHTGQNCSFFNSCVHI